MQSLIISAGNASAEINETPIGDFSIYYQLSDGQRVRAANNHINLEEAAQEALTNVLIEMQVPRPAPGKTEYDYTNQAWVVDGKYIRCSHTKTCTFCYGTTHEGEAVDPNAEVH